MRATPSLRQRALAALARREHSRVELARKLAPYAEHPEVLDALLNQLEEEKLLSAERFADSLVHRRSGRYGSTRIARELDQHGLADDLRAARLSSLRIGEFERCKEVWRKKFGVSLSANPTLKEQARQARFLLARGFPPDIVRRVLRSRSDDENE